ncbi:hypothetical protein Pta02_44150 [Planobispora takensis]|uniref:Uncharacterized protein n=2 Tax=Planobispora takensis TaxID=1367882 RepID=A0A8J3WX18_9ACTN|nr:hypothetical protein Pta02_44150 [Planobispora takensis]
MPDVTKTIERWEAILSKGLGLNALNIGKPVANYGKGDGTWLYLEGFTLKEGREEYDAHITITKSPVKKADSLEWTYCHFTANRAKRGHIFYQVDDNGDYRTTTTLLNIEGKVSNGKTHYKDDQINDASLQEAIDHDIRLILRYLARG